MLYRCMLKLYQSIYVLFENLFNFWRQCQHRWAICQVATVEKYTLHFLFSDVWVTFRFGYCMPQKYSFKLSNDKALVAHFCEWKQHSTMINKQILHQTQWQMHASHSTFWSTGIHSSTQQERQCHSGFTPILTRSITSPAWNLALELHNHS